MRRFILLRNFHLTDRAQTDLHTEEERGFLKLVNVVAVEVFRRLRYQTEDAILSKVRSAHSLRRLRQK